MDYVEGLNLSIAYIEDNLFGEIEYERATRIAGMSKSTYQRFFLLIANMTLDEYVRKRKIQYAVKELIDTDYKAIDIAMKYGYASATAFSRAVHNFTGNTPSKIRKEGSSVCFTVDCVDPENEAWEQMSEWCKKNVPDRTARRYVGANYQEVRNESFNYSKRQVYLSFTIE